VHTFAGQLRSNNNARPPYYVLCQAEEQAEEQVAKQWIKSTDPVYRAAGDDLLAELGIHPIELLGCVEIHSKVVVRGSVGKTNST
jgi:hypothetical protein